MSLFTLRSGATAHPEDSVLQFMTDLIASSGVVTKAAGTTHFSVQAQGTPDMTVKVKAGRAHIKGSSGNAYPIISDTDTSVAVGSNGSGSTRIDAVVLYVDKGVSANSDASNIAKLIVVQGTTSAPSDSTIQSTVGASNPFIRLANVTVTSGATSIVSGNISDQRIVSRFQLSDLSIQNGSPVWNGWTPIDETLTFAAADAPDFQVYFSGDVTAKYYVGLKVKFTNNSTTFQGFITKVGSYDSGNNRTPVDIYGGTDYSVANSAITSPYISALKAPQGFPLDRAKWTVEVLSTSSASQAPATNGTWYNIGPISIDVPIGSWDIEYFTSAHFDDNTGTPLARLLATLSTANNSESDPDLTSGIYIFMNSSMSGSSAGATVSKKKSISVTTKTTYYLNHKVMDSGQANVNQIALDGGTAKIIARAICAYL